jgi:hypothetical protein
MKARILLAIFIALTMGSWMGPDMATQSKGKDSISIKTPPAVPAIKKPAKKGVKLLFESVLYHFM